MTFAANAATTKDILPTGKGLDVQDDPNPPPRTRYKVEYHNAPVLAGASNLYIIYYGYWSTPERTQDLFIITDFLSTLGWSPYFQIAARYPNASGQAPSSGLLYGGAAIDAYSHGPTVSDADVADIVSGQILTGELPLDPSGIYIVMASPDIAQTSGLFGTVLRDARQSRDARIRLPVHIRREPGAVAGSLRAAVGGSERNVERGRRGLTHRGRAFQHHHRPDVRRLVRPPGFGAR